jgi:hypothetical protein
MLKKIRHSKIVVAILLGVLGLVSPCYAVGVAVVQSAAPTSDGGTQDFTLTGFGTPVCAMFIVGFGTANGTVVDHAALGIGFSDFTNEREVSFLSKDTAGNTDTGTNTGYAALRTLVSTDQTVNGTAVASTITDGVRLTWADAPPSAYLVTVVMFNSNIFSNCKVGTHLTDAVLDGSSSQSGFGWQPDLVLSVATGSTADDGDYANIRQSIGLTVNDGGVVQYASGWNVGGGDVNSDIYQVVRSDRLQVMPLGTSLSSTSMGSFDSGGFTVITRDTAATKRISYLAAKLATGKRVKLLDCMTPTTTGNHSCTGTGWTPEAGIMLQTIVPDLATYYSSGGTHNESYGISAFDASNSYTATVWQDDGVPSNAISLTNNKAVHLRKDGADFMVGTLTGFQSNGADFNYTTMDSTTRHRPVLFFETAPAPTVRPRRPIFLP